MKRLLAPGGVITMEFPHLLRLMAENQFDTIYHEHFSCFSFATVERVFAHHGLAIFDVEELATHGGSLYLAPMPRRCARSVRGSRLRQREIEDLPHASRATAGSKSGVKPPSASSWLS
jgi:hypothetical protein